MGAAGGQRDARPFEPQSPASFEDRPPALDDRVDVVETRAAGMNAGDLGFVIPQVGHRAEVPALERIVERGLRGFGRFVAGAGHGSGPPVGFRPLLCRAAAGDARGRR